MEAHTFNPSTQVLVGEFLYVLRPVGLHSEELLALRNKVNYNTCYFYRRPGFISHDSYIYKIKANLKYNDVHGKVLENVSMS